MCSAVRYRGGFQNMCTKFYHCLTTKLCYSFIWLLVEHKKGTYFSFFNISSPFFFFSKKEAVDHQKSIVTTVYGVIYAAMVGCLLPYHRIMVEEENCMEGRLVHLRQYWNFWLQRLSLEITRNGRNLKHIISSIVSRFPWWVFKPTSAISVRLTIPNRRLDYSTRCSTEES